MAGHLAYFAAADGYEDLMLQWLSVDEPAELLTHLRGIKGYSHTQVWRGKLFRSIIRARFELAVDRSADAALSAFFKFVDAKSAALAQETNPESNWSRISVFPAMLEIKGRLASGAFRSADPPLYDRFLGFMRGFRIKNSADTVDFSMARLMLFHPAHPTPRLAITYLRRYFGGKPAEEARASLPQRLPCSCCSRTARSSRLRDDGIKKMSPGYKQP